MKNKNILILYFFFSILFIVFTYLDVFIFIIASKSLLIPLLTIYFLKKLNYKLNLFRKLVLFALLFCWIGDVSLEFDKMDEIFFLAGLFSFLIGLIFYTLSFIEPLQKRVFLRSNPWLIIPFLIYGIIIMWILFPDLGNMALPVIVYASVIIFLVITSLNRFGNVSKKSFRLVFTGTLVFAFSNTFIAINKFTLQFILADLVIISTYVLAQYLIIEGCIEQET